MKGVYEFEFPYRLPNMSNGGWHHFGIAKERKNQRTQLAFWWRYHKPPKLKLPLKITLTRIAPRSFDQSNLVHSFKSIQDEVALSLGYKDDYADGLDWAFDQLSEGSNIYKVRINIREV